MFRARGGATFSSGFRKPNLNFLSEDGEDFEVDQQFTEAQDEEIIQDEEDNDRLNDEASKIIGSKESGEDNVLLGPQWLLAKKGNGKINDTGSSVGSSSYIFSNNNVTRYSKKEILDFYKPSTAIPSALSQYPIVVSEESLTPMAFLSLDPREEVLFNTSFFLL